MKKFLLLLAAFLLPAALVYGLFAAALVFTRELAPVDEVVEATAAGEMALYGTSHNENIGAYKFRTMSALGADFLVLGTSRSMQLRGEFFTRESFYNAGGVVRNMADFTDLLSRLPEDALPDTLLVVLDQNMFNTDWRASSPGGPQGFEDLETDFLDTLLRTAQDYASGKFSLFDVLRPKAGVYGLAAAARGTGFALDGSYRYGILTEQNLDAPEKNFSDTYRQIDFGQERFAYGDTPDPLALTQLEEFLALCREKGIRVVGFLPPLPPRSTRGWRRAAATAISTPSTRRSPRGLPRRAGSSTTSPRSRARTSNTSTASTAGTGSTPGSRWRWTRRARSSRGRSTARRSSSCWPTPTATPARCPTAGPAADRSEGTAAVFCRRVPAPFSPLPEAKSHPGAPLGRKIPFPPRAERGRKRPAKQRCQTAPNPLSGGNCAAFSACHKMSKKRCFSPFLSFLVLPLLSG